MKRTPFVFFIVVLIGFVGACAKFETPDKPAVKDQDRYRLAIIEEASVLTFDETAPGVLLKLVLQLQDGNFNPLQEDKVFVDFRVTLKQDGETHVIVEESRYSENGKIEFLYAPELFEIKPKVGGELTIHYRFNSDHTGAFLKQHIIIFDPYPDKISIVSGDAQEGVWNAALEHPLVIQVTNRAGEVLKDIPLKWTVNLGKYSNSELSETQEKTDDEGLARSNFTLGVQLDQPETIVVEVLGNDGNPIPELGVTFTYKLRRFNYSLLQLGYPKSTSDADFQDYSSYHIEREWKNGDDITIQNGLRFKFRLKLDEEVISTNVNVQTFSIKYSTLVDVPFSNTDVVLKNIPVLFTPLVGRRDSVVVNLTIKNDAYRHIVGKTLTVEAKPEQLDSDPADPFGRDIGEVLTIKFGADGKAQMKSKKWPTARNKTYRWYFGEHNPYVWLRTAENGSLIRKEVIGQVYLDANFVDTRLYSLAYMILSDLTVLPTDGDYFDSYVYFRNINRLVLE